MEIVLSIASLFLGVIGSFLYVGKKFEKLDNVCNELSKIDGKFEKIWDKILSHEESIGFIKGKLGEAHSPMKPTKEGMKLLNDSGFMEIYPAIKDSIFSRIDEAKSRTLYDYEQEARYALNSKEGDPVMDKLKDYVINHPTEATLYTIFTVASWIIRDDYAEYKKKKG